jgi:hypothetical protein
VLIDNAILWAALPSDVSEDPSTETPLVDRSLVCLRGTQRRLLGVNGL